jgi:hypothetical protein
MDRKCAAGDQSAGVAPLEKDLATANSANTIILIMAYLLVVKGLCSTAFIPLSENRSKFV